jgi:hypothetical protein
VAEVKRSTGRFLARWRLGEALAPRSAALLGPKLAAWVEENIEGT